MTRRNPRIAEVSIVAAIEVAVLRLSGADDDGRVAATMVSLPTTSSGVRAATIPDEYLAAALTVTISSDPSLLYFLWSEFVIVGQRSTHHLMLNRGL